MELPLTKKAEKKDLEWMSNCNFWKKKKKKIQFREKKFDFADFIFDLFSNWHFIMVILVDFTKSREKIAKKKVGKRSPWKIAKIFPAKSIFFSQNRNHWGFLASFNHIRQILWPNFPSRTNFPKFTKTRNFCTGSKRSCVTSKLRVLSIYLRIAARRLRYLRVLSIH